MDLEKLERKLRGNGGLGALADSPEGKALAAQFDEASLRTAAERGDTAALQDVLRRVLSTPEGRALAEKVQKAVGKP
jgi:hypothetical protein